MDDIIKTTIDIIAYKGTTVNFSDLLSNFNQFTAQLPQLQSNFDDAQKALTDAQTSLANIVTEVQAVYAQYPDDVPENIINAFGLTPTP